MTKQLTVFVTGATGNQGGAVARALLDKNHKVRALTRHIHSPAAKALAALGAELVEGGLDESELMTRALRGADTLFLMGSPMEIGVEREAEQGIALADAAKAANIGHLIYSSVANADKNTGIPHFESKYRIEQHIKSLNIPYTICAPAAFMDNVVSPWMIDAFKTGKIIQALAADIKLQQVSLQNLGQVIASLANKREEVFGKRFDIAGDEITGLQMANILSHVTQRQVTYEPLDISVLRTQSEDMALMFEWLTKVGYSVDIKKMYEAFDDVDWQNYQQWANSEDWRFMQQRKSA